MNQKIVENLASRRTAISLGNLAVRRTHLSSLFLSLRSLRLCVKNISFFNPVIIFVFALFATLRETLVLICVILWFIFDIDCNHPPIGESMGKRSRFTREKI